MALVLFLGTHRRAQVHQERVALERLPAGGHQSVERLGRIPLVGTGGLELVGALFVLLGSLAYAVAALVLKRRLGNVQPVAMAAGAMSAGAAYLIVPAAVTFPTSAPPLDASASLAVLGVGGTGIAFLFFYTLVAQIGAARASIVAYLAPGFAVFYGVTVRDEVVTPWTLVGLALVLGGSWLASRTRPAPRRIEAAPAAVRSTAR